MSDVGRFKSVISIMYDLDELQLYLLKGIENITKYTFDDKMEQFRIFSKVYSNNISRVLTIMYINMQRFSNNLLFQIDNILTFYDRLPENYLSELTELVDKTYEMSRLSQSGNGGMLLTYTSNSHKFYRYISDDEFKLDPETNSIKGVFTIGSDLGARLNDGTYIGKCIGIDIAEHKLVMYTELNSKFNIAEFQRDVKTREICYTIEPYNPDNCKDKACYKFGAVSFI